VTRYRVPVSDALLAQKDFWDPVEGFRLVSVDGPWLSHPHVTICTFEDDAAPARLEGLLVEPVFSKDKYGSVKITARSVVHAP
jgi:hypothetical protein